MSSPALAFVTVVYEPEVPLLQLQARSLARYLPSALCDEIVVIDNSARGMAPHTREKLVQAYGSLRDGVRILRPRDIADVPLATGWRAQQVLKLQVAGHLRSERYVLLDAKNHAIGELRRDFFEASDGRPRVTAHGYETHPLRPSLEHVLAYLGLDPAPYVSRFTTTITPFVLDVPTVRAMIADIENRSGRPFAREFVAQDLTEFFLYAGWIISRGTRLDEAFATDQPACPTIWPRRADVEGVKQATGAAEERSSPLFAVHRRALAQLPPPAVELLVDFWLRRGLVPSVAEGVALVAEFKRGSERYARRQRVKDVPLRGVTALRRLRRVARERVRAPRSTP